MANWRLQHLRGLWRAEMAKPVEWEWIYTWGSPTFVRAGEIYRIHSVWRVRAASHALRDDVAAGRVDVYAAGPAAGARIVAQKCGCARLVDASRRVIGSVVV